MYCRKCSLYIVIYESMTNLFFEYCDASKNSFIKSNFGKTIFKMSHLTF